LIYIPGGGWSTTSERGFYEASVQKPVFTEIEANELVSGEEIVCISAMYSLAAYDFYNSVAGQSQSHPSWATSTTYSFDNYVFHNPGVPEWSTSTPYSLDDVVYNNSDEPVYRCILAHTSSASDEPGVGGSWTTYWESVAGRRNLAPYRCVKSTSSVADSITEPGVGTAFEDYWIIPEKNDIGNRTEGTGSHGTTPGYLRCMSKPGKMQSGVRDVALLVKFVKQNATFFGIDPEKIVLYGDSAGGSTCGTVAYSHSSEYSTSTSRNDPIARDMAGALWGAAYQSHDVSGLIGEWMPSDWRNFADYNALHGGNLFGIVSQSTGGNQTEYDRIPASLKAALSPLGSLYASGKHIPTFLNYVGQSAPSLGSPPWSGAPYHASDNGVQVQTELTRLGETNIEFYHDGNIGAADIGELIHDWLRTLWSYPLT